ncbi:MAG: leucyl aminopeptidase, partial [Hyphomicrobiales bacterium]|nr:leucyl aminopeptidase [Hyphomicrobiales bacterium]
MLPSISFAKPEAPKKGCVIVLVDENLSLGAAAAAVNEAAGGILPRAFAAANFKGKEAASLDLLAVGDFDRVIVLGVGKSADEADWTKLGGVAMAEIARAKATAAEIALDLPEDNEATPGQAAGFAEGMKLRAYAFDRYKTKKNGDNGDDLSTSAKVTIRVPKPQKARAEFRKREAVVDGTLLARDLVNEPGNVLGPAEFANRVKKLEKLGVNVDILGEKELKKLGMRALLGVAQGSVRSPRVAVMRWNGGKAKSAPVCFVGKG